MYRLRNKTTIIKISSTSWKNTMRYITLTKHIVMSIYLSWFVIATVNGCDSNFEV